MQPPPMRLDRNSSVGQPLAPDVVQGASNLAAGRGRRARQDSIPGPSRFRRGDATGRQRSRSGLTRAALLMAVIGGIGALWVNGSGAARPEAGASAETRSAAYEKHKLAIPSAPVHLSRSDVNVEATRAAIEAAKAGRPIPGLSSASPELVRALAEGKAEVYTVRALDTCAEDGDHVTVTTDNGARVGPFMLTNAGTVISVPAINGVLPSVQLIADKDGEGGITVAVQSSGGTWYSSIMAEGQMQAISLVR